MGIEYSTALAWGREIDEKHLQEGIPGFDEDPWNSVYLFCIEEFPLLQILNAGDNWSGEVAWALVIKSTVLDVSQGNGVFEFREPSSDEKLQFSRAYGRLADERPEATPIAVGHIF